MSKEGIIHCLIAYETTLLAEYAEYEGNFNQNARQILAAIINKGTDKGILKFEGKKYFFVNEEGLIIMCLTEKVSNEVGFSFIYDVKREIYLKYPSTDKLSNINPFTFKSQYDPILMEYAEYFSGNPSFNKNGSLIDDFKTVANSALQDTVNSYIGKDFKIDISFKETPFDPGFVKFLN